MKDQSKYITFTCGKASCNNEKTQLKSAYKVHDNHYCSVECANSARVYKIPRGVEYVPTRKDNIRAVKLKIDEFFKGEKDARNKLYN